MSSGMAIHHTNSSSSFSTSSSPSRPWTQPVSYPSYPSLSSQLSFDKASYWSQPSPSSTQIHPQFPSHWAATSSASWPSESISFTWASIPWSILADRRCEISCAFEMGIAWNILKILTWKSPKCWRFHCWRTLEAYFWGLGTSWGQSWCLFPFLWSVLCFCLRFSYQIIWFEIGNQPFL